MDFFDVCKKRYSCRAFNQQPVDLDVLESIVATGGNAPVGVGRHHSLHFTIVTNPELVDGLRHDPAKPDAKRDPLYNARAVILVSSSEEKKSLSYQNVGCAIAHMELAATALGVESLYVFGIIDRMHAAADPALTKIDVPEGYEPIACLALGYTDEVHPPKSEWTSQVTYSIQE